MPQNYHNTSQLRHPFYTIYISKGGKPRKKHYELGDAITEAGRLAKEFELTAFVTEYDGAPFTVCRCTPDGKIEQM